MKKEKNKRSFNKKGEKGVTRKREGERVCIFVVRLVFILRPVSCEAFMCEKWAVNTYSGKSAIS